MADPSAADPYLQPRAAPNKTAATGKPGASRAYFVPRPVAPAGNTQTLEAGAPSHSDSQRFYHPLYPGQKPTGFQRERIGVSGTSVPYWVATRGPTGDSAAQLSATDVAAARRVGVPTSAAMSLLNTAVHPLTDLGAQVRGEKPFALGGVVSDVGNIASNFIPVGKAAGILGGLRGLKAIREAKVTADALDTEKIAKTEEETTSPQDALRGTFKGARAARKQQDVNTSAERAQRFAAAETHMSNQALPPDERIRLAKGELKGEFLKIDYQGVNQVLDEGMVAKLQTDILNHPTLMTGQKLSASEALTNALAGKVPRNYELTLLEHVFGKDTANSLAQISKHPFKDTLLSVLNIPRSLMATADLSAPFRQGLAVATRHPVIFFRNFAPMVKAFGSDKVYNAIQDEIRARPNYPLMMEAKLALTDLGRGVGNREEQFYSGAAENLNLRNIPKVGKNLGKYGTGPGDIVRASGRAYTGFLDKVRADVFDHLVQRAQNQSRNVHDAKFLKDLGRLVNTTTGRGPLGPLQGAASSLNTFFFSPRLLASRLDLIFSPVTYAKADPFVRKEAIRSMVQLAGTASTLMAVISQVPGAKVVMDPRNPDWGKIKLGNTRIDIGGGFQQPLRLFAQLATGVAISSTTGKKLNLTAGGFGQPNRLDLFLRFFEGKESPLASLVTDYMRNSNQVGTPFKWTPEIAQRMIPLLAQDSYDLYKDQHGGMNGLAAAFAGYGVGSVGFGMQTYGPKTPAPAPPSGADPYLAPRSSSGTDPYLGGR